MAPINAGDRVRFLNEPLEGTVTRIIDGRTVGVTTDDDFEIPVLKTELVKITFAESSVGDTVKKEPKTISEAKVRTELGVFLLFEPKPDGLLHMKLLNLLSPELVYTYGSFDKKKYTTHRKGSFSIDEIITLETVNLNEFNEWPEFVFNFIPCPGQSGQIEKPIHKSIRFKSKEFHGSFKFSKALNKQAYVFRLDEEINLIDLQKLRSRDFNEPKTESKTIWANDDQATVNDVVDLHLQAIPDIPANLKPSEAIQVQFGYFRRSLEKGLAAGIEKMIFIHGIGDGILKRKIREYLHGYPKIKKAGDADEFKYGKGATEVEF